MDQVNREMELKKALQKIEGLEYQVQRQHGLIQDWEKLLQSLENSYRNLKDNFDYQKQRNKELINSLTEEMEKAS